MLQFYYDCLDTYVKRSDFELTEMDTDSLYLALSSDNLADVIKPDLQRQFYADYDQWFPSEVCADHRADFISTCGFSKSSRPDCQACRDRKLFDKRTPGLFKLEYDGEGMISLCSKTYHWS